MPDDMRCVKGRACLLENVYSEQTVTHSCCFFCLRKETASGKCPFFCSNDGKPRTNMCKEKFDERYGDIV